ncbi:MAG: VTT domain-containing protein [Chloroflexi bacterium]|nr:VTT domain-containing protein [Chloroflexota bacterium]
MATPSEGAPAREKKGRLTGRLLRRLALVAVLIVSVAALLLQSRLGDPETAGYPALFLISLLGNASIILPVPAFLAICYGGATLSPVLAGMAGGLGQALGETTGYVAGFSGSDLAQRSRLYKRVKPWMDRCGWLVVLAFALIPLPLFDVVGLIAGATRMPLWQFLVVTIVGKTLRAVGVAVACSLGYDFFFLPKV